MCVHDVLAEMEEVRLFSVLSGYIYVYMCTCCVYACVCVSSALAAFACAL
jgi:hypothetical protein